jgi:hypothetical protein
MCAAGSTSSSYARGISCKHADGLTTALLCLTRAERSEKQREKKVVEKSVQAQLGFTGQTTTTPFWVRHFLPKAVKTSIYTYIIDM